MEIAEKLHIPSTFVETNCYWCVNDRITREKLQILKDKGLRGIMISVNPFYLEYVPFRNTKRCIEISDQVFGNQVMIYQMEYFYRFQEWQINETVPIEKYLKMEEGLFKNTEFFLMGRAVYQLGDEMSKYFPRFPAQILFRFPCAPPFLRNWHNHIDNYGNYIPGFCGGLSLGKIDKLNLFIKEGIDTEQYPILDHIIKNSFEDLFHLAQDTGYKPLEAGYFSKCHLCVDIRKHLAFTKHDFKELQPREFYDHIG